MAIPAPPLAPSIATQSQPAPELKSEMMVEAATQLNEMLDNEAWHLHFADLKFTRKLGKGRKPLRFQEDQLSH